MTAAYPLHTERLVLRPLVPEDVDVIVAYRNDPAVAVYQDWSLPVPRERVEQQIAAAAGWTDLAPGQPRNIGIEAGGELVGDLYAGIDENGGVAEIGFTLRTEHQGKGYAFEAASALVADLIERLGCHRVFAQLSPENARSARLLEKLGMHVESLAPASYWCRGAWDDNLVYAMSADEWRHRRAYPRLLHTVLDARDIRTLAEFYRALLGLVYAPGHERPVDGPDDRDWLILTHPDGRRALAFQADEHHVPPTWPRPVVPQQVHLDLTVPDTDALATQRDRAVALGARVLFDRSDDPDEPLYVFADPAGHPFCIFVG